jgi:hypothetical protein
MTQITPMRLAERSALDASMILRNAQRDLETFNNDTAVAQQLAISKGLEPPVADKHRLLTLARSYSDAREPWRRAMDELQGLIDAEREAEKERA